VQDTRWEGRLLIEAADAQETQHQQLVRADSSVSQEVLPAPTSLTPELSNMMVRADSGDHVSQETLGDMCADIEGRVVPDDVQAAIDQHHEAADQGDSTAQYNIGVLYFDAQEYSQAMIWSRKAAEQGHVLARDV